MFDLKIHRRLNRAIEPIHHLMVLISTMNAVSLNDLTINFQMKMMNTLNVNICKQK
jgi:hypothetical protein